MPRPFRICPRCGGSTWTEIDESHTACADCGLGASTGTLMTSAKVRRWTPWRRANRELRASRDRPTRALADATFTPYGLDGRWTGPRWLGGHGRSNDEVTELSLAHGSREMTGPQLRVRTRIPRFGTIGVELVDAAHELVMTLAHEVDRLRDDVRQALFPRGAATDPFGPWTPLAVEVDGASRPFHLLAEDDHWVAVGALTEVVLSLEGRQWDPAGIGLVPVADLTPYEAY